MNAQDIHAFTPATRPSVMPPRLRQPHRVWLWVVGGLLLIAVALAVASAAALLALIDGAREGMHVVINGEPWGWSGLDADDWLPALLGISAAMLAVLVVIPVGVLFGLLLGGLGVALGLAVTLGAVGLVLALALSPLWLVLLLLWLVLRPRLRSGSATAKARMAA